MKWTFIYTLFASLLIAFGFLNYSAGPASSVGTGNTGAPGDEMLGPFPRTCVTCHGGSSITTELSIEVMDENNMAVSEYVPGEIYRIRVSHDVSAGSPQAYGFQIVSLFNSTDSDVAGFSNPDDNTQIAIASSNGRQYAEHNFPNSDTDFFELDWTAPEAGSGDITFYSCGNAVNLNGSNTGDGADCATLSLSEDMTSSLNILALNDFVLFPNPVASKALITFDIVQSGTYDLELIDLSGKTIWQSSQDLNAGVFSEALNLENAPSGTYFLSIRHEERIFTTRVIKQ